VPKKVRHLGSLIIKSRVPSFSSSNVEVLDELLGARILKVSVNGRTSCCKVVNEFTQKSISRELVSLQRILDAKLPSIRVPKPVGLVKSDDKDIIGILLEYIQPNPNIQVLISFELIQWRDLEERNRQIKSGTLLTNFTQLVLSGVIGKREMFC
jgi:hypothetical protein